MSGVCACTAAAMHWAAVTSAGRRLPRRMLSANMLASAVGGMLTAQALDLIPWATIPPLLGVSAAAVVGHTLGPRALWWFGTGALGALEKYAPWFKAEPLPEPKEEGETDGSDQRPVPPQQ